ncbi:Isoprenylcysteine carboxyl methyltransferase family-domain-containing protein [Gorgonomyces haynaldii]|nr:Isoprenylcysteine carboxyl methyltransferase family-domain-containing protein [Gorgonomyces haynaldii]
MGLQLLHGNWLTLVTVYLAVQSTERYSPPEISPSRLGLGFLNLKWFNGQHTQQNIALYSSGLGLLSGFGLSLFQTRYPGFGYYFFLLGFFHTFEYISTVMFKADAGLHSFLLNHSPEYHTAMIATLVEYLCELYLFPSLKQLNFFFFFLLSFGGQLMRTSAMWTAGVSFDHHVQYEKKSDHTLVTNGIYQYLRHPSYTGFYYWATFLQIALGNPICFVAFCYVLYKYFEDRIEEEEQMLIQFFGDDYVQYKKRSFVLIPGIP